MSVTAKPPTHLRLVADSPGDVDGLLRAFFRAEMPLAWPALPVPAESLRLPAIVLLHKTAGAHKDEVRACNE